MRPFGHSVSMLFAAFVVFATVPLSSATAPQAAKESKSPEQKSVGAGKPKIAELDLCCQSDQKSTTDVTFVSVDGVWRPDNPARKID